MIKIWIDDIRTPPSEDWIWIKSVNEANNHPEKRKVAAYARVSTEHEEQHSSYEAQIDYYKIHQQIRTKYCRQFSYDKTIKRKRKLCYL